MKVLGVIAVLRVFETVACAFGLFLITIELREAWWAYTCSSCIYINWWAIAVPLCFGVLWIVAMYFGFEKVELPWLRYVSDLTEKPEAEDG